MNNYNVRNTLFSKIMVIVLSLLLILSLPSIAFATDGDSTSENENVSDANSAAFAVKAILPENQEGNSSYFNLKMNPNEKQTLSVEVISLSEKDHTIHIGLTNGQTNSNGDIDYGNDKSDSSLKNPFTEIASLEKDEILLRAGETAIVKINLNMPKEEFDGKVLGGIRFLRNGEDAGSADSTTFSNDFAYLLGAVLFENETTVPSDFKLEKVSPEVENYLSNFVVSIKNNSANIEKDMELETLIYKNGELYSSTTDTNVSFAPNSQMDYAIKSENNVFEPGDYVAKVNLKNSSGKSWDFEYEFSIDQKEAKQLEETTVMPVSYNDNNASTNSTINALKQIPIWTYIIAGILFIVLIEGIVLLVIKLKNKPRRKLKHK